MAQLPTCLLTTCSSRHGISDGRLARMNGESTQAVFCLRLQQAQAQILVMRAGNLS